MWRATQSTGCDSWLHKEEKATCLKIPQMVLDFFFRAAFSTNASEALTTFGLILLRPHSDQDSGIAQVLGQGFFVGPFISRETLPTNFQHFPTLMAANSPAWPAALETYSLIHVTCVPYTMESFLHMSLHEVSLLCLFTSPPAEGQSSSHPTLATSP